MKGISIVDESNNTIVSVIIPTYNREKVISRTVNSVLSQTENRFELIIVDDGSEDGTKDLIHTYVDSRIRYFRVNHRGANYARNYGLSKSRGKYIAFLDSDVVWERTFLEKRVNEIESKDGEYDLIFGKVKYVDSNDVSFIPDNDMMGRLICNYDKENWIKLLLKGNYVDTSTALCKKNVAEEVNGFDEAFGRNQDWDFFLRLFLNSKTKVMFSNDCLVTNYIQLDSISKNDKLYLDNLRRFLEKYKSVYEHYDMWIDIIVDRFLSGYVKASTKDYLSFLDILEKNERVYFDSRIKRITSKYFLTSQGDNCEWDYIADIVRKGKQIYLYGSGEQGIICERTLAALGIKHNGFVVSDSYRAMGENVICLDKIPVSKNTCFFIITVANWNYQNEISSNLTRQGYKDFMFWNGSRYYCVLCRKKISEFYAGGLKVTEGILLDHSVIGAGVRKHCICPNCGSRDRTRWVYKVLDDHTNVFKTKCNVLHFAPDAQLQQYFEQNKNCKYISADIEEGKASIIADITNIPLPDNSIDYVIANHVLEHVKNECRAIEELKRITKLSGEIILSFPICMDLKTIEEKDLIDDEGRIKMFGQRDHVRIYGYDFRERLEKYGLIVDTYSPRDYMDEKTSDYYGFIREDIVIICRKL